MSDREVLRDRIEQLLIEHTHVPGTDEVQAECVGASCTWRGWFLGDWRRHVAEVIADGVMNHERS
ncbi:hypothetical protein NIIDNTM18_42510 [Mycolicibacterium litorale]|uniref:Uncharacterized protein n=1 Tax=Mycolicibacterium litorale TaxID=758802 RepID=A0A6S6P533_9MYCO|nr:hypothetical protein [Mycolicibacterium litorale]BCI54973.1 hypothetical protein NIIDNTM18_42510 [Mycolicibacterium litorale]